MFAVDQSARETFPKSGGVQMIPTEKVERKKKNVVQDIFESAVTNIAPLKKIKHIDIGKTSGASVLFSNIFLLCLQCCFVCTFILSVVCFVIVGDSSMQQNHFCICLNSEF